ncbi:Hypothetical predicted protein [Cloeon dipterum]|uniref:Uncharacterized protein n=1 Tax=Cloeon dipterum TaxID=197152 RepID=A0A8S1DNK4_9INSE|nr:Hypothetical predicted protein [Cloeon dipterum]
MQSVGNFIKRERVLENRKIKAWRLLCRRLRGATRWKVDKVELQIACVLQLESGNKPRKPRKPLLCSLAFEEEEEEEVEVEVEEQHGAATHILP